MIAEGVAESSVDYVIHEAVDFCLQMSQITVKNVFYHL